MSKLKNKIKEGLGRVMYEEDDFDIADTKREIDSTIDPMPIAPDQKDILKAKAMNKELSDLDDTMNEVNDEAMQSFIDQYGEEEGKSIYYATAEKRNLDPETMEKIGENFDMVAHDIAKTIYPDDSLMYGYMEKYITNNKDIIANVARELANMGGNVEHVKNHPVVKVELEKNPELGKLLDYPELLNKIQPIHEYNDDLGDIPTGRDVEAGEINYNELNKLIDDLNASGEVETGDEMGGNLEKQDGADILPFEESINPRMTKDELMESVMRKTKKTPKVIKRIKVKDIRNGK